MFGLEKSAAMAIGAGVLILALIGAILGLINYGQKLGKLEAEKTRLAGELVKASDWKDRQLKIMAAKDAAVVTWETKAAAFEREYLHILNNRPEPEVITRWRNIATDVPALIPLGDCDIAAVEAWNVLNRAGMAGVPP